MTAGRKIAIAVVVVGALSIGAVVGVRLHRRNRRPLAIRGAVIRQSMDPAKRSPVISVDVTALSAAGAPLVSTTSDFFGFFSLPLPGGVVAGQSITLNFRAPGFQPLDQMEVVGDRLLVIAMIPLHGEVEAELDPDAMPVTNVLIRYSAPTDTVTSIGTDATTFQVMNTGNVPCDKQKPCSPDGRWKAAIGSASLDAGDGNVFRNARASCIAGPCPFTKIDTDEFSRGGRKIGIAVRDWSDTTTFLLEAEVLRSQIDSAVRTSHALIFGRSMNFTIPAVAEGTSIEAEIGGRETVFPLGPTAQLSWADCNVQTQKNQSRDFRCELKPGFRFQ